MLKEYNKYCKYQSYLSLYNAKKAWVLGISQPDNSNEFLY